jgi:hypothetical protein
MNILYFTGPTRRWPNMEEITIICNLVEEVRKGFVTEL